MRHTFPKSEHLTSQKVIDRLFHRDKPGTPPAEKPAGDAPLTVYAYPFRVLYFRHGPGNVPETEQAELGALLQQLPQVLFSVPKRAFKKAVDRNAVRRRVKEAYRLHKHRLVAGGIAGREFGGPVGPRAGGHDPVRRSGPPLHINDLGAVAQPSIGPVAQIVFLYTAKTKISFEEIEKGMKLALKRMYNG